MCTKEKHSSKHTEYIYGRVPPSIMSAVENRREILKCQTFGDPSPHLWNDLRVYRPRVLYVCGPRITTEHWLLEPPTYRVCVHKSRNNDDYTGNSNVYFGTHCCFRNRNHRSRGNSTCIRLARARHVVTTRVAARVRTTCVNTDALLRARVLPPGKFGAVRVTRTRAIYIRVTA